MDLRAAISKVLAGRVGGPHAGGIHTYHSSPHDFSAFDKSKLLSGEGANVYGAGFYSAENPAVSGQGGQYWQNFLNNFKGSEAGAASSLHGNNFNRTEAIAETKRNIEDWQHTLANPRDIARWPDKHDQLKYYRSMLEQRQAELALLESGKPVGPRTYELNIKAKPEELLDWDRPLKYQPEVLEKIRSSPNFEFYPFKPEETGNSVYTGFVSYPFSNPGTTRNQAKQIISDKLGEAGVPGIKYLDEGSRQHQQDLLDANRFARLGGENTRSREAWQERAAELAKIPLTRNHVTFDPGTIDILAKYGVGGAAVIPPTLGAFTKQDDYEVSDGVR
jgi:hypothetical protein